MNITVADLRRLCPKAKEEIIAPIVAAMPIVLPAYGITSALRFDPFIAQSAHECMGFTTLNELGGSAYFEKRYGMDTAIGRRLGNTQPGDGARYHGRGIFQLTGRSNYIAAGKALGLDLVGHPEWAADPAISLRIACWYWGGRGLNALADRGDFVGITRKINGGTNGLAQRQAYLAKAKAIWGSDAAPSAFAAVPVASPEPPQEISLEPPPVAVPAPVALPPAPAVTAPPVAEDAGMANMPAIATEAPPSLGKSKTLWGNITGVLSGGGLGYSVNEFLQNPNALWILLAAGGFLLVAGIAVLIVFRERIAKRVELGI